MPIELGNDPEFRERRDEPKATGEGPDCPARYLARWTWILAAPSFLYALAMLALFLLLVARGLRPCPRRVAWGCGTVGLALIAALIAAIRWSDRAGRRSLLVVAVAWCLVLGPVLYLTGFLAYYLIGPFSLGLGAVAMGCAAAAVASRGRGDRTTIILVLLGCGSVLAAWHADSVFRADYSDHSAPPPTVPMPGFAGRAASPRVPGPAPPRAGPGVAPRERAKSAPGGPDR